MPSSPAPAGAAGEPVRASPTRSSLTLGLAAGAAVGLLGGMIGLGGAEFRLPLLISLFGFSALSAVILNKAMSLIVVLTALPARLMSVPYAMLTPHGRVVVNLLAGGVVGAWAGASWATRMRSSTLYRVIAGLLVLMAGALVWSHISPMTALGLGPDGQAIAGVAAGFAIGVVAAVMGVAGGELLIPTIVLLYAVDIKVAGSLSLAVSLPMMLTAFARYSRDRSFVVLRQHRGFALTMTAGSIAGALAGASLLGAVPDAALIPALALVLVISAIEVWRHR